jgi:hypothetical protein
MIVFVILSIVLAIINVVLMIVEQKEKAKLEEKQYEIEELRKDIDACDDVIETLTGFVKEAIKYGYNNKEAKKLINRSEKDINEYDAPQETFETQED